MPTIKNKPDKEKSEETEKIPKTWLWRDIIGLRQAERDGPGPGPGRGRRGENTPEGLPVPSLKDSVFV